MIGQKFETNNSGWLTITGYENCDSVTVKFDDTGYTRTARMGDIRLGRVKDYFRPSVYGVGFIGDTYDSNHKAYTHWIHMLGRCYSESYSVHRGDYDDVTVCEEWHNYTNFVEWFNDNYIEGGELDKDKLQPDITHKVYSPTTCVFLTPQKNMEVAHTAGKVYKLIHTNGRVVEITNIRQHALDHDICPSSLSKVIRGVRASSGGWRLCK